ncbi:MAG: PAS domain S-box protein [Bacteroidales bacterium]
MKIRLVAVISGSGESTELLEGHIRKITPSAQIVRVTDVNTATAIISEHSPELILVDTVSAGIDGFAVCEKLKHDERTGIIPQICFYSPDEREKRLKALKSGADGVLPWPPDHDELRAMAGSLTKRMQKHKKQLAHLENTFTEREEKYRRMFMDNPQPMWIYDMETLAFLEVNEAAVRHYGYSREEFMSMNLKDIRPADDIEALLKNIDPNRKDYHPAGEWRHLKKNGELIYVEIISHNAVFKGSKARHVMVNDITERRLASEQASILNERLSFLVEAIQELSSSASMKEIMKTVMNSARGLLNADGAAFVLRDGDLCYYADEDAISPLWKGQRFMMDNCMSGWVMKNRQAVIIEDIYAVNIIPHEMYRSTFVRSLAMAPIRLNNPLGVIGVYWSTNITSSAAELQLLQTLADAAAKAVENVQLIEGLERTISDRTADLQAVNRAEAEVMKMKESLELLNRHLDEVRESERAAIAREIHDQLGQSLTALKIDVNYLHDKMADASEEQSKLELMSGMITEMIKDVQRIASELRPPILDDLGLVSAMEWYIMEFEKRTGVKCRTNFDSVQFPMEKKNLTLYRILQEALTNVSRHAGAKKVEISLTQVSDLVSFKVADDGTGFDSNKIDSFSSLGFLGIRERLKQHDGHLEIETAPGKGTRLNVTLPFN